MDSDRLNAVFDLDNVIVEPLHYDADNIIEQATSVLGETFIKDHLIVAYDFPHLVFPGFYALWQWLDTIGAEIHIFSSGVKERNHELVEKLIEKSFCKPKPTINIFSREHCIDTATMPKDESELLQTYFHGQRKKKLADVVISKEKLLNTLLIEDDSSYSPTGEENNLIIVPSVSGYVPYPDFYYEYQVMAFHKAFYISGLLQKIIITAKDYSLSFSDAARLVQVDFEQVEFFRFFAYPGRNNKQYYLDGLENLRLYDKSLKFYFEWEQ